jgi:hypothetical protein
MAYPMFCLGGGNTAAGLGAGWPLAYALMKTRCASGSRCRAGTQVPDPPNSGQISHVLSNESAHRISGPGFATGFPSEISSLNYGCGPTAVVLGGTRAAAVEPGVQAISEQFVKLQAEAASCPVARAALFHRC